MKRLLVTGSSGLIGSEVCTHFAQLGWEIHGVDNNQRAIFFGVQRAKESLEGLDTDVADRVDSLGPIPPLKTHDFVAAIDLGLLSLEGDLFDQNRFPIKYTEYKAASPTGLASDVGEYARFSENFKWVIKAGRTETEWLDAFSQAVNSMSAGSLPHVDIKSLEALLSWSTLSQKLLDVYLSHL